MDMNKQSDKFRSLKVTGMSCGHCTAQVQTALESLEDVLEADVSLQEETATIRMAKDIPNDVLTRAITAAGYRAEPQ
jgi:Cu+-exporting ATPase|tara:strand:+ start:227 stop:457 length:231 start_codon:yes stop_codon:yes gene_type:complete